MLSPQEISEKARQALAVLKHFEQTFLANFRDDQVLYRQTWIEYYWFPVIEPLEELPGLLKKFYRKLSPKPKSGLSS
ncbi:MAG: hypothetical protein A2600_10865 [Candidatus Lambdaproteobacteria bacterium RIFOXYD1_FULL_56_27]|uniref:Uncharacterized protein n=1 Tax=Candidatus Lambdaproteobacteria bacterium RIFOXYD2_FULL_56_26 TaxID=1817773 RepID=A0A1F6H1L1_9PROT|nr:MAG: hypothetical protein A2557_10610 [Candidatus Lambdaproteobacteria bacterium RIFOXYD2_FULL_56_26]OGH05722.1 MAG: hypothetical protein A2426_04320 [Candidatus Lambdaproteobacteria bacterium RIFOXYC1_FULL_56_13]OGH08411.1 MAG: hypothetical protein A2600_10865 [Candidatus Lambdaproteobacteria bacterium RIFOXYD1_FULL_56_27]